MAQQAIIVKPGGNGGFRVPVAQAEIARVDVVDVDLVIQTKAGARFVLPGAGIEAMSDAPPQVSFSDGNLNAADLMQRVGVVDTPDVSIPVMSSITEHDPKDSSGPKNLHGDGPDQPTPDATDTEAVQAQAEAQGEAAKVSPLAVASDSTVEKLVQEIGKQVDKLHDKAADPVPVAPYEPQAAAAPGVGAAPNPVSLTPLVVISLGNVVGVTGTAGAIDGSGATGATTALDGIGVRDAGQFAGETITGSAGNDTILADGAAVGGTGHFAKAMSIQISGYFTKLDTTLTISGLPADVGIDAAGAVHNADGTWTLPITYVTDETASFKLVYGVREAGTSGNASGVYEDFTMTVTITGYTRGEVFTSVTSLQVQVRDADSADDISVGDGDGAAIYILPAQGTPNYVDAGDGNDTITGGYGNDTLIGGNGDDIIDGSYGNDTIDGGAGDDVIDGGGGDDFIRGGSGANVIDGGVGTGIDTVSYEGLGAGIDANLTTHHATGAATDTLTSIENLIGTNFADTLTGNAIANVIHGLDGADTIDGMGGADRIYAGGGDDRVNVTVSGALTIDGGAGVDTIDLTADTANHTLNLASGVTSGGMVDAAWVLNFENALMGGGNDTVTGTDGANAINGGAGNNAIYGQGGDDVIAVTGSIGANALYGGTGADTITGGDGSDNLYGDSTGSSSSLDGADTLHGGAGADTLWGSYGADLMDGGTGSDTVTYQNDGNTHVVVLDANGDGVVSGGNSSSAFTGGTVTNNFAYGDHLVGIENLIGGNGIDVFNVSASSAYHTLTGNNGNDTLTGGNGGNRFDGGNGNDTIAGGSGADFAVLGSGSDLVDLGSGQDTLYTTSGNSMVVVLDYAAAEAAGLAPQFPSVVTQVGLGSYDGFVYGYDGGSTTAYTRISGVDDVTLTGSGGNDLIVGNDTANTISAGGGRDTIYGMGGDDMILGGAGDNTIDGGSGNDTASFSDVGLSINANLATGNVGWSGGSAKLAGIENLIGTTVADILRGDAGDNSINGGTGNDTIYASAGHDSLVGGGGTDLVSFADLTEGVTASLADGSTASVVVGGVTHTSTLTGFSNLEGSSGNDILTGNGGANTIWGGAEDDTITGGGGADTLVGGTGADTFRVSSTELAAISAIWGNVGNGADTAVDTLTLTGTSANDASGTLLSSLGKLGGIDAVDFTGDTSSDVFTLTAANVQAIVDNREGSDLTVRLNSGDVLTISNFGQSYVSTSATATSGDTSLASSSAAGDTTYYVFNSNHQVQATIHVDYQ